MLSIYTFRINVNKKKLDAPAGFEPTQAESKSAVLPLDEGAVVGDLGIEPSCREATDLQSAAVANAAHHPGEPAGT